MKKLLFNLIIIFYATIACAEEWKVLDTENPPPARFGHSIVTLPDGRVLVFGGENSQDMYNDLFAYDSGQWRPLPLANQPPAERTDHCLWYGNNKVYVHAGKSKTQFFNDLWSYDLQTNQWTEIQTGGTKPSARYAHTATLLADETVLLLGGEKPTGLPLPEAWKLNTDLTYTQLSSPPMGLSHHTTQRVNDIVFVFAEPGKTFTYDVIKNEWSTLPVGPPLWGYAASALGENEVGEKIIYVFGGIQKSEYESNFVYEFNTVSKTLTQRQNLMPFTHSCGAAAVLLQKEPSSSINRVLLFGGKSNNQIINITFLFSPFTCMPGDVNYDGNVDLKDVILSLKIISGLTLTESVCKDADVNGDRKIGNEETVYIIQKIGEISKN